MGLQSAMTTALTGLQAAETTIDVVGNNVANSNTVGFKESNVLFATQFLQTQSIGSAPSAATRRYEPAANRPRREGGRNRARLHAGHDPDQLQSARPGHPGRRLLHRAGPAAAASSSTRATASSRRMPINELVTITGDRVLGYGVNDDFEVDTNQIVPLTIPFGGSAVAQETNNVNLSAICFRTAQVATRRASLKSVVLSDNSVEIPDDIGVGDVRADRRPGPRHALQPRKASATGSIGQGTYSYRVVFRDPRRRGPRRRSAVDCIWRHQHSSGRNRLHRAHQPAASDDPSVFTSKVIYRINDGRSQPASMKWSPRYPKAQAHVYRHRRGWHTRPGSQRRQPRH